MKSESDFAPCQHGSEEWCEGADAFDSGASSLACLPCVLTPILDEMEADHGV